MKKIGITWIDDDPNRVTANGWPKIFENGVDLLDTAASLEVFGVTEDVLEKLAVWTEKVSADPPDLLMIDHSLTKISKLRFGLKGSSLAHLVRRALPNMPIVCITAGEVSSNHLDFEDISEYTQVFSFPDLSNQMETLFRVALDYPRVCVTQEASVREAVLRVLQPPPLDSESLMAIFPEEFEINLVHGTTPHRIARWIINTLMSRPGFLGDDLDVATYLGVSRVAFNTKFKPLFEQALYRGPFASSSRPLWWLSALNEALYAAAPEHVELPPNYAGRKLPGANSEDFSICYVTKESQPPPNAVAYLDETTTERHAMRREFTTPISTDSLLGFAPRLRLYIERRRT